MIGFLRKSFASVLLGLLCGCTSANPPEVTAQGCCGDPGARVSPLPKSILSHDFGPVEPTGPLEHTFVLENPTGFEVRFEQPPDIGYPCCVEVVPASDGIPANGKTDVVVRFTPKDRPGPFDVFIRLYPSNQRVIGQLHIGGVLKAR